MKNNTPVKTAAGPPGPPGGFTMQWYSNLYFTRSSAVAERPCDAPCHWKSCYVTQDCSRSFEITPL